MNVEDQQLWANKVLSLIETFDPTAIIAGGAPRDWWHGREASDFDCFVNIRTDFTAHRRKKMLERLGFKVVSENSGHQLPEHYKKNPDLLRVITVSLNGCDIPIQLMQVQNTFKVVDHFPLNLCKIWYKDGVIRVTKDFNRATAHKALVLVNELYAEGDRYVKKIMDKYPDYHYYDSYETLATSLLDGEK